MRTEDGGFKVGDKVVPAKFNIWFNRKKYGNGPFTVTKVNQFSMEIDIPHYMDKFVHPYRWELFRESIGGQS